MLRLDCPRCGQANQLEHLKRGANEFCTNCDYPLFWVVVDDQLAETALGEAGVIEASLRRLPGTAGRLDVEGESCPRCSEMNHPDAKFCSRCGLELHPPPAPPPPPEPAPAPAPVVEDLKPPKRPNRLGLLCVIIATMLALIFLVGIQMGAGGLALTLVMLVAALGGLAILGLYWRSFHRGDDKTSSRSADG